MSAPHPAIGLTSAVAVAAAATLPGSLVHEVAPASPEYRIGTLSGSIAVQISDSGGNGRSPSGVTRAALLMPSSTSRPPPIPVTTWPPRNTSACPRPSPDPPAGKGARSLPPQHPKPHDRHREGKEDQ